VLSLRNRSHGLLIVILRTKREREIRTLCFVTPMRRLFFPTLLCLGLISSARLNEAHAQADLQEVSGPGASPVIPACADASTPPAIKEALRLVCAKSRFETGVPGGRKAIIVGFLGGFVKPDDKSHPEVWFADYLRGRYGPSVHVAIFGNHEENRALTDTLQRIRGHRENTLTANQPAAVIIYGVSWGASQGLAFARDLERQGIPVALTIQVDSVRKFGQDGRTVPGNVAKAVNFYQTGGLTPGQSQIVPADAEHTKILGNFRMSYAHQRINCSNYKWLSRVFNKPHHLIENDPHLWERIVSLIDSELVRPDTAIDAGLGFLSERPDSPPGHQ
jgi:hypothetical protein